MATRLFINDREYVFHPLAYDDALEVTAQLGGALLPSLGAIMEGPVGQALAGKISREDLLDMDPSMVLSDVDPVDIGKVLGEGLRRGDLKPAMVRQCLSSTTRDGVVLVGQAFDDAFRGNMAESFIAMFHAMLANGLFRLPSTSETRPKPMPRAVEG